MFGLLNNIHQSEGKKSNVHWGQNYEIHMSIKQLVSKLRRILDSIPSIPLRFFCICFRSGDSSPN